MENHLFTNRLINESSPYLLQHAHNPVDWYPWGQEALQKAKDEDKPILVSIGYAACHWCHVMERESFENKETADLMNQYFINIKIDREERPDLDQIYMDAVQAIAGNGGWPLNVFLMPDAKPFYGGTYFPPIRAHNRVSWTELIESIHLAFSSKRQELMNQSENLVQHLLNANNIAQKDQKSESDIFGKDKLNVIAENILANADTEWGGFGNAPKFPQTFAINYLLRHYHFTGDKAAFNQAVLSLNKMMQGGIYDQLGGGFSRYSTDAKWLAPHFEKMLYDNALLLNVYAEAFQLTQNPAYEGIIRHSVNFIKQEFQSEKGGFYSAFDADSEGIEGKYYTWSKAEIDSILNEHSDIFCKVYDISEKGNWEHTNILWLPDNLEMKAEISGIELTKLNHILSVCHARLLAIREERIKPQLDDKILLNWNALMVSALCKCYAALGDPVFLKMAEQNIRFLETELKGPEGIWFHSFKKKGEQHQAFLDDYAALVSAYINLQEVTGDFNYLISAKEVTNRVLLDFTDEDEIFFYYSPVQQKDVIIRKKEVYDGATPSGNSLMAYNLLYLSIIFDNKAWRARAEKMIRSLGNVIIKYPASFGNWAITLQMLLNGIYEIAIVGHNFPEKLKGFLGGYIPSRVLQSSVRSNSDFPLLKEKNPTDEQTLYYICSDYQCYQPFSELKEVIDLFNSDKF